MRSEGISSTVANAKCLIFYFFSTMHVCLQNYSSQLENTDLKHNILACEWPKCYLL